MNKRNKLRLPHLAVRSAVALTAAALMSVSCLAAPATVTAQDGLRLRAQSNTSSAVLTLLRSGSQIEVLETVNEEWYRVSAGQQVGYVASQYVRLMETEGTPLPPSQENTDPAPSDEETVPAPSEEQVQTFGFVTASSLNVRSGPGTGHSKVTSLSAGAKVELLETLDGWYRIERGYVSADYITVLAPGLSEQQAQVVAYAHQFLGYPYVMGANGPNAFDCSSLTQYVYKHFGYTIRRTATQQLDNGTVVSKENLLPGDLVFFNSSNNNPARATHVGIYIGEGKFLHASSSKVGVVISSLNTPYYTRVFTTARRIL